PLTGLLAVWASATLAAQAGTPRSPVNGAWGCSALSYPPSTAGRHCSAESPVNKATEPPASLCRPPWAPHSATRPTQGLPSHAAVGRPPVEALARSGDRATTR